MKRIFYYFSFALTVIFIFVYNIFNIRQFIFRIYLIANEGFLTPGQPPEVYEYFYNHSAYILITYFYQFLIGIISLFFLVCLFRKVLLYYKLSEKKQYFNENKKTLIFAFLFSTIFFIVTLVYNCIFIYEDIIYFVYDNLPKHIITLVLDVIIYSQFIFMNILLLKNKLIDNPKTKRNRTKKPTIEERTNALEQQIANLEKQLEELKKDDQ